MIYIVSAPPFFESKRAPAGERGTAEEDTASAHLHADRGRIITPFYTCALYYLKFIQI